MSKLATSGPESPLGRSRMSTRKTCPSAVTSAFRVWKGAENQLDAGFLEDFNLSLPKGQSEKVQATLTSIQPLLAPIQKGQKVGTLTLAVDGQKIGEYSVVALKDVPVANWFGRLWDALVLWFKSL